MRKQSATGGAYHWREYGIHDLLPTDIAAKKILLFGCGDAGERPYLRELGANVVAFDITPSPGTDLLADAHHLPLQDAAFDLVLSMQVLEHLHSPWLAVREISRVLRPGGWFVGSVAFLKPYHDSYFHITHKGIRHLLASYGLEVEKVMGAQSLTYTFYGLLMPLGKRSISRFVYGAFDRLLGGLRARLWSLHTGLHPDRPTNRFDGEMLLSFREFEKLRFAPAVVFRAQKTLGVD